MTGQHSLHGCLGLNVGIVGGGIAGLYTALLLQRQGHCVRIFEGTDRIGGRVYTHYFTTEKDQYYEAGAMRIPNSDFHKIVFQLIDNINSRIPPGTDMNIELIKYVLSDVGNDIFINGHRPAVQASSATPASVGWDVPSDYANKSARELLSAAIGEFIKALKADFDTAFEEIVRDFDDYTFRYYCSSVMGWPSEVIDFVETVTSQTNQFTLSVPELVMQNMDFDETDWRTIDKGMSRLPQAMAYLVGYANITFGARVTGLEVTEDDHVQIRASGYNGEMSADFDRVVLAIPPAALRMITERPRWSVEKEMAIRSIHFEALYKMGMRFKTRFWERVTPKPSNGGQSTTDLPIRWIVFPSNGIDEDGPGVLLVYAWMTDASNWLPLTPLERRSLALECLATMYQGKKDGDTEINVHDLLIETSDAVWSASTATGDAMFLPGQFSARFNVARQPEGNVYFAGEHLSYHHTWISGAADSALNVVRDMLDDPDLPPLTKPTSAKTSSSEGDFGGAKKLAVVSADGETEGSTKGPVGLEIPEPAKVPFEFTPSGPTFGKGPTGRQRWRPGVPGDDTDYQYSFPTHLGTAGAVLGAVTAHLKAPSAMGI
ncbi:hypothetical protein SLS62_011401 [Diatrype stigma]|uniref:Amine oxidase n=1 Tax=Diatrype stigma TaxID=117547 RepID=A0AAN9U6G4_9PEZI